MFRSSLIPSTSIQLPLTMLAVLLLLLGTAFPGTSLAQEEPSEEPCQTAFGLPPQLAELDVAGVRAALQDLVNEDPEATVGLVTPEGSVFYTVSADLLLADEAVIAALLEDRPVNLTVEFRDFVPIPVVVAIEVSTMEDCTIPDACVSGIELPAALADLEVADLRTALGEMVANDADATVAVTVVGEIPAVIRADLLLDLSEPVLAALLAGGALNVTVSTYDDPQEITRIALPDPHCAPFGGPPETEPGDVQDDQQEDQQGGAKPTVPGNQQMGDDKGTVTKTFQLTLNGTVPADQAFSVGFGQRRGEGTILVFCGDPHTELTESQPPCKAGVYMRSVEITAGTTIGFAFVRTDPGADEVFHSGTETLSADMTNTAWYTFGNGRAAGDEWAVSDNQQIGDGKKTDAGEDQQDDTQDDIRQDGEDKDTGKSAGDDTQDDTEDDGTGARNDIQDDVQVDQQREIPEEMPATGAGGLATGPSIPIENAVGLTMHLGAGFAVLRRR